MGDELKRVALQGADPPRNFGQVLASDEAPMVPPESMLFYVGLMNNGRGQPMRVGCAPGVHTLHIPGAEEDVVTLTIDPPEVNGFKQDPVWWMAFGRENARAIAKAILKITGE